MVLEDQEGVNLPDSGDLSTVRDVAMATKRKAPELQDGQTKCGAVAPTQGDAGKSDAREARASEEQRGKSTAAAAAAAQQRWV